MPNSPNTTIMTNIYKRVGDMHMKDKTERLLEFLNEDDGVLFEQMLENLTDEELSRFLESNPDFFATS